MKVVRFHLICESLYDKWKSGFMKKNIIGILYFFVHFIIEVTSFYIVTYYSTTTVAWILALAYDFFAFVPQGFFGFLKDKGFAINFAVVGMICSFISLLLLYFDVFPAIVIFLVGLGNAMIHIEGAYDSLASSEGKMSPSAIFVAGGSFGVVIGQILSMYHIHVFYVLFLHLLMIIPLLFVRKYKSFIQRKNFSLYHYDNPNLSSFVVIFFTILVVIIRAYMGYGIPTAWNKTIFQTFLLYSFMGIGKALGGIFIDRFGIRKTAFISTIGSLLFLLFGDSIMVISLLGVMLFSMTMAITLGLLVSRLNQYPGVAFGLTTIGLFLGTLPVFFVRVHSLLINCILVIIFTIFCAILLSKICRKEV